jgi:hypothetical protein
MDTLDEGHFTGSVFSHLDPKFWHKRVSCDYAKQIFGYKLDAWHLTKSFMIACLATSVVMYQPTFPWWVEIPIAGVVWIGVFVPFYEKILKTKTK